MFLTRCVMVWSVWTALSLCVPVRSALEVIQPYRVVSTNGTAQVRCVIKPPTFSHLSKASHSLPYNLPDPEELRVTLLKGLHSTQVFCWFMLNLTQQRETVVEKEGQVQCSAQLGEGAVELTVSGLQATDTDLYRCQIEVFFPPPYLRLRGNGTLVHVLGNSDCPVQEAQRQTALRDEDEEDDGERSAPVCVPVVVLVILVTCALLFIVYLQALQCERGRREIVRPAPGVLYKGEAAFSC
ncbi:cytotoxic T-lymphocyte protein 4 [Labrus mixtus]|uniref:cytotoxic T-lymphocyte protein 4 n=1 Tax=Labrus mixtus TaxID=508554 RepID=UPI0029BFF21E|nr:cytotoxic T-lymphocyte protein 4 [Labrus mixtus]